MITLIIIIIIVVWAIAKSNSPDKKSSKQQAIDEERTANLPDMAFYAKEMTPTQKALNMWPGAKDLLQEFRYSSNNRIIYLKMKDGRFVNCPLSALDVTFDKVSGIYRIVIKNSNVKFSFYQYDYVFTDKEWDIILSTLTLAGTTHNVEIMGSTYKNLTKVNTVLKIIKALQ